MNRSPAKPLRVSGAAVGCTTSTASRRRVSGRLLVEAELVEPRAGDEAEVRAAVRREVERSGLARDLDRMQRLRVQRGGAEPHALGDARHRQQREERRLEEEVVEHREDVEARRLGATRDLLVALDGLVGLQAEPELERRQVSSSVGASARRSARCA